MHFRSLEHRIVSLFLILILAVQAAGFIVIRTGIDDNARKAIRSELLISEKVFRRLLDQNAQRLTQGARLLAADYGFKQAVASNERETIASALANHGARIGASLTLLIGPEREITATTATKTSAMLSASILRLVDEAEETGSAASISLVGHDPYQLVVVPVKAPLSIAWVAMAFPIDQGLIDDMRELSGLQVSVLTRDRDGRWNSDVSTLPESDAAELAAHMGETTLASDGKAGDLTMSTGDFTARALPLAMNQNYVSMVLLQRSVSEAIAPYRQLQMTLLILTSIGVMVAVAGSFFTARRITTPIKNLAAVAERFGRGDYSGHVARLGHDEIGALSVAFESMRAGIVNREAEIGHLAYWDTLTDLPNRARFTLLLEQALALAAREQHQVYVLMLDLDRFKNVNDVLGHAFGDALLRQVAHRLKLQLAEDRYQLARLSGDEFVLLLPDTSLVRARAVAAAILTSLEVPITLDEQTVDLGAGIGIAGCLGNCADAALLLAHAEIAMYASKKAGNGAVLYDPEMDKGSQQNLSLLSELRTALDNNEFRLYVQPKIAMRTGQVIGMEALVRWVHPVKGMIFPDAFIPFSEQTGFIRMLTQWVLEQSAALSHALEAEGISVKLSANLSTRDLLDQNLPQKFAQILARHNVKPGAFCLEITESAIMDDPIRAQLTLEGLNAMGVELSIDDFGTGYSSLAYLKRLPVDELKIDKSFVMNMEHDADDAAIVRSTIDLAHNMGLRVVAEGIESVAVWNLLAAMGCDHGQGYFMSRPIPAAQLQQWIAGWTPPATAIAEVPAPALV